MGPEEPRPAERAGRMRAVVQRVSSASVEVDGKIVGEIDNEHDPEEAESIQPQDANHYHVRALTRIEEFNDYFQSRISDDDYDTVGGLVIHELGRLPRRGESIVFAGFRFKVLQADRRRVHSLEVERNDSAAADTSSPQ